MDSADHRGAKQRTSYHKTKTDVKLKQSGGNVPSQLKVEPQICVCGTVQLQIDTASDINLISQKLWKGTGKPQFTATKHVAWSVSGDCVLITGKLPETIRIEEKIASEIIYISNSQHNLLGLDFIGPLGLLDIQLNFVCHAVSKSLTQSAIKDLTKDILKRFSPVFTSNLGCCSQAETTPTLKPSTKPMFRPKRPGPYAALPLVDKELKRLKERKDITPVKYSRWTAPIVVVKKADGPIRSCAVFLTGLNAILDHQYPMPIPEDIFTTLNAGTCFAILDLTEAYLQVEVSANSKEVQTIKYPSWPIPISTVTVWGKNSPGYFPTNPGHYANRSRGSTSNITTNNMSNIRQDLLVNTFE